MEVFSVVFILLLSILFGLIKYVYKKKFSYWRDKGVYSLKPSIPFGNIKDVVFMKYSLSMIFCKMYEGNSERSYFGTYMLHKPALVVNDVAIIKAILIKDFIHFTGHGFKVNEELEPLTGHLFNLDGVKWKNLRTKLTPTFTSNKMKLMFDTMAMCSDDLSEYLDKIVGESGISEIKDLLTCFSNDVIANCAFGIQCKSFGNPNDQFKRMGKRVFNLTLLDKIFRFLNFILPYEFSTRMKSKFGNEVEKFFLDVVEETVTYREKNGILRNDFMQLLIELKNKGAVSDDNGKIEELPDDGTRLTMKQLAAQVFVFFIAGFETSSTTASFALYELAMNPDVQSILAKEIDEVTAKHDGKITYNSLLEMNYLTQVIEETLRKYPPVPIIFRVCTKEYTIPDTDVVIEKDTPVMIPIYGIQRDPRYFQNPDKFEPERFDPENKKNIHHFAYLPFGEGPRICIGNRFGMMQTRLGLATILSKYEISPCEKTLIPMKYDVKSFILTCDGGVYLNLKKRVK